MLVMEWLVVSALIRPLLGAVLSRLTLFIQAYLSVYIG